ncbi:Aspartate-tRNA ligase, cytoplasmic 2 [Colletotrichum truncatum]|uniref:Aspartate-tRNA ligase, cytoplasmic 2 n=1 Tax=Colletotrichum truncatum TaxID=5467 RepID=A0ACC3YWV0_COLTU
MVLPAVDGMEDDAPSCEAAAANATAGMKECTAASSVNLEDDPFKNNYGDRKTTILAFSKDAEQVEIRSLDETYNGKKVVVRAWLQNTRVQSAKTGFVELRKGVTWDIQDVIV